MQKFIENIPKDETCFLLLIPASLYHSVFFFGSIITLVVLGLFHSCTNHVLMFLCRYAIVYLAQMKPLINPILSGE